ncbi:DoxX family protein [Ferruginibacter sp. SUN106]|uniref:DoxX family protein n=1 Tax=Ferruginibacter sp. SUN106 TaxID=2978348 RepID=UPI003D3616C5
MKKLLSTKYSAGAFSTAMLVLRLAAGILMLLHGYDKLMHFAHYKNDFMNFMGIGSTLSLALAVFAEFFCSLFLILGLFTRLATIPLIIVTCVIIFKVDHGHISADNEKVVLFLCSYIVLLLVGPGRVSVDSMIGK